MNCAGQVKIVGDKLHLSSGCPPDKLSSLAYFYYQTSIAWSYTTKMFFHELVTLQIILMKNDVILCLPENFACFFVVC